MAPGMLRSRRRDVCMKPNRVLDKSSSRGMIYENEELRLRTININAEIERGQSELKKLKRENDHLRREIWALRDEVDRLEALLKQKEQEEEEDSESEESDEEGDEGEDEGGGSVEPPQKVLRFPKIIEPDIDGLSVVPEESEEGSTPEPQTPQVCLNPERRLEEYKGALPPCIRLNCVHPYTTATTLKPSLVGITTVEVIEEVGRTARGLVGVRLLEDSLYLSWRGKAELEAAVSSGVVLRGERYQLHDVSQGTVVLAMSAIPHTVKDQDLVKLMGQFGPVIGGVERRLYKGADTGEGLIRLRPLASLPKRLYLEGSEISVRLLCHDELSKLSMEQHQVRTRVPSSLNIRLEEVKLSDVSKASSSNTPKFDPFTFPSTSASTSTQSTPKLEERSSSAPASALRTPENGSTQSLKHHSDSEVKRQSKRVGSKRGKSPSSSSEQDSPAKPPRRRASLIPPVDRERSNSLSSRASYSRRKMSMTGRETGKLPWCACWGNGCY